MSSSTEHTKPLAFTEDVLGLADALGAILDAKLKDTFKKAIASEAELYWTDALCILTEVRNDIKRYFADSEVECGEGHPSGLRANLETHMTPIVSGASSKASSVSSLPITGFHFATSLEHRLAVDIFESAYGERGLDESTAHTRRGRSSLRADTFNMEPSASSRRPTKPRPFKPLIPSESVPEHLPHPFIAEDSEASLTTQTSRPATSVLASPERIGITEDSRCPLALNRKEPTSEETRIGSLEVQGPPSSSLGNRTRRWKVEANNFYCDMPVAGNAAWGPATRLTPIAFRAFGLVPWSARYKWLSRIYQCAFLCCLVMSTVDGITNARFRNQSEYVDNLFASHVDQIVGVGTLLSFLAVLWKSTAIQDASWLIESYLSRAGCLGKANKRSSIDNATIIFIWALCVGSRLYACASAWQVDDFEFAFNVLVLLAVCAYVLRICRCLVCMVSHFCSDMQDNNDFQRGLREFFLLHCTMRTACISVEWCFVVLLLITTCLFLSCSASIYAGAMTANFLAEALIPAALCEVALLHLAVRAGRVSDLCAQVPMLVTSVNAKFEMQRMHVVDYIVHCQAGFYVFEVRVETAKLLKLSYVAFVAWCGVLTQDVL